MHRVNQKPKKVLILRYLAYGLTLFLTIVTTVTLLYIALGYRFDRNGHVVQNGLLLVDNRPQPAKIIINGQERDNTAPGRFVLPAATYDLILARDGYRSWRKDVLIAAGAVRTVQYPLLLPQELQGTRVAALNAPYLFSQSLDKKQLLLHRANAETFELITLDGDPAAHTVEPLAISAAVPRENGQIGTFTVIEWALNNRQLLLEQTLPSGNKHLISFDITKPEATINITTLYKEQAPQNIHYVGGKTSMIYGIKDGVLMRYSLEEVSATTLLSNVRQYQPYGDTAIAYDRLTKEKVEIGVWQDDVATVVHRYPVSDPPASLQYFQYDDHFYLASTNAVQSEVIIYRDPIKKPILRSQLPYITFAVSPDTRLVASPSSQFLLALNGLEVAVYDFEDTQQYRFDIDQAPAAGTSVAWATGHHLAWQAADGKNHILDYDGTNQQQLQQSTPGRPSFYTGNMEALYDIVTVESVLQLQYTSLVVEE